MIVKYRKSFFNDVGRLKQISQIEDLEFITEFASITDKPENIPGFKKLRQYPGKARIEMSLLRIGVEVEGNTLIFIRVLPRAIFYQQFP